MNQTMNAEISRLVDAISAADAVMIGAGSGLSTAAGFTYSGERFKTYFADFIETYGLSDMYSAGFYPFKTLEEQWAYWSRNIWYNRYVEAPKDTYDKLLQLVDGKDFFVLTTNVDHRFQLADFPKERLFYTQGDYGLWQCSIPCHDSTYDNFEAVARMVEEQHDMRVPSELVPYCPRCGEPMSMNLRCDATFVEDAGWHQAARRYQDFIEAHGGGRIIFLELGVGSNTPGIIKFPFWKQTYANASATYACVNFGQAQAPAEIRDRSILINGDIHEALTLALQVRQG
ncbi:Sir2 silent information regulator family NAD-dependent deacetylase [uncultured Actinomyces sp.]|uniref:SIR2 family NAD-dependent protein deacylase n=1 Tax=uncultured Actinomyces sp. TaxID=249061 RepID=UPI0028E7A244|nr:Sir2 silent information regulator family NAD-dependent deacetylase [uncultured Actinomyces sp.]